MMEDGMRDMNDGADRRRNEQAWNSGAYQAWVHRFGLPGEAASKLKDNPAKRIGKAIAHMGDVGGKRIVNLLGSNGVKAAALALLGAEVAVIDYSSENRDYALELADELGVRIRYIVSDVLALPESFLTHDFDIAYMEQGVLHYFVELRPLFRVVRSLLRPGGTMVLHDFHPVSTKLISSKGTTANIRKHKVTGDYFDTSLVEKEIAFSKYLPAGSGVGDHTVRLRNWTLGEIVTAVAGEGLFIKALEELPNLSSEVFDAGIPKTFILAAEKV